MLSLVVAVFGGLPLFATLHCNTFPLSILFPVIVMNDALLTDKLVTFVDPRNHVVVGIGNALLLNTQPISRLASSANVRGLSLGIKETLFTSTIQIHKKKSIINAILTYFNVTKYFDRVVLLIRFTIQNYVQALKSDLI